MWFLQEGPTATKHKEWMHPIVTFLFHYAIVVTAVPFAHDILANALVNANDLECNLSLEETRRRQNVAKFLAVYFAIYFAVRLTLRWSERAYRFYSEFYGITFTCSVTIPMSAMSFYTNRPIIAQAFCLAVGIDQSLWYFDMAGFLLLGIFPIGVCKYLFKPGSNWINRMTSTHHLWTIPLVMWVSGGSFHWLSLPLSFFIVAVSAIISHLMTPVSIKSLGEDDKPDLYLNVNLSHEMWEDVKLKMFRIGERRFPYILRLICWWSITNTIMFILLYGIPRIVLTGATPSLC
eukprot:jgi/Psemu1/322329/estExt_fgenesh1_pg.C_260036